MILKDINYFPTYPLFECANSDITLSNIFLENVSSPLINFVNALSLQINRSIMINSILVLPLIIYEYFYQIKLIIHNSIFRNITNLIGHGSVIFLNILNLILFKILSVKNFQNGFIEFNNCSIINNTVFGYGNFYIINSKNILIKDCLFIGNFAQKGGAIYYEEEIGCISMIIMIFDYLFLNKKHLQLLKFKTILS